jgi:hypothetical protein
MKKIFLIAFSILLVFYTGNSYARQSIPEGVVEALTFAAKKKDYLSLRNLCFEESDETANSICSINASNEGTKNGYSQTFSTLKISGDVSVRDDMAEVPVSGTDANGVITEFSLILRRKNSEWKLLSMDTSQLHLNLYDN